MLRFAWNARPALLHGSPFDEDGPMSRISRRLRMKLTFALLCAAVVSPVDANAVPPPCPGKLRGLLVAEDPNLKPTEAMSITASRQTREHLGPILKSITLNTRNAVFPIKFELDIAELKECDFAIQVSVRGDTEVSLRSFHFADYVFPLQGKAFTIHGRSFAVLVLQRSPRF